VALDRQRRDAVMGEEQRRGEAHKASAHDQDGDFLDLTTPLTSNSQIV
jgi:hypothetical protein